MLTFQARGHQNALFWMQIFKKNPGVRATPPCTFPQHGRARGRFAPPAPPSQTNKLEPPPKFFSGYALATIANRGLNRGTGTYD